MGEFRLIVLVVLVSTFLVVALMTACLWLMFDRSRLRSEVKALELVINASAPDLDNDDVADSVFYGGIEIDWRTLPKSTKDVIQYLSIVARTEELTKADFSGFRESINEHAGLSHQRKRQLVDALTEFEQKTAFTTPD